MKVRVAWLLWGPFWLNHEGIPMFRMVSRYGTAEQDVTTETWYCDN
jgi:hypothetical protein